MICLGLGGAGALVATASRRAEAQPTMGERERAIAERACTVWADALTKHQQPDGRFGLEPHRAPSGWTTGQMLLGLAVSHRACGRPGPSPIVKGLEGLAKGRQEGGWRGVFTEQLQTPATAWAVLALTDGGARVDDAEALKMATSARAILWKAQRSHGGFRFRQDGPDETNDYTSVLALWALLDLEAEAPSADGRARIEKGLEWLRKVLQGDVGEPPLRRVAGLQEQAIWVWLRARAKLRLIHPDDEALTAAVVRDLVERCQLDIESRRCLRPIYEDGRTYLDRTPKGPNLLTLWHPWVVAAALALARDEDLPLSPEDRTAVADIGRWGLHELEAGVPLIATAPGYKLAEYLIAVADGVR